MSYRIGIGYDIHPLVQGRTLVLGGVNIPFDKGLLGHSDGDVIIHVICDAILGALAKGDIGQLFPDTEEHTCDMYSLDMLRTIVGDIVLPDYAIINIDVNCISERPRLSPYRGEMVSKIANVLRVEHSQVSIKFRTHEGFGDIGKGNAMAADAVVLLKRVKREI